MKPRAGVWGCLALAAALAWAHGRPAGAQHQLTLKAATTAAAGSPTVELLSALGQTLSTNKGRPLRLKVFTNGSLGNEAAIADRTREGTLQLYAGSLSGLAAHVPELQVLEAPGVFKSLKLAERALDRGVLRRLRPLLEDRGFVFAAWGPAQARMLFAREKPIRRTKGLAGRRMFQRTSAGAQPLAEALGMTPVTSPLGELAEAVRQGRIDVFDDTLEAAIASTRAFYARHLTLTRHAYAIQIVVYSKRWLDGLPEDTRRQIQRLPKQLAADARERSTALEQTLLTALEQRGLDVHEPSPAEGREFRRVARRTGLAVARQLGPLAVRLLRAAK